MNPGRVAVLINRAHAFTDLVLPIDKFEDRLLDAWTRSAAGQLPARGRDERRALSFFERLCEYDQIGYRRR